MKKRVSIYLMIFVILHVIQLVAINDYIDYFGTGRMEVELNQDVQMTYDKLVADDRFKENMPVVINQKLSYIGENQDIVVTKISTNSYYNDVANLYMINGSFFEEISVAEGRHTVIISDELAEQLYGSHLAAGNECLIDGTYYQVGGVYKKHRNIWDILADDTREEVYIPITSGAEKKVEQMIFDKKQYSENISESLLSQLGIYENNSFIYTNLDFANKLYGLTYISIGIMGCIVVYYSIKALQYMWHEWPNKYSLKLIVTILVIIILGVVCKNIISKIYVPISLLPADNIFDIGAYWRQFKTICATNNYLIEIHISSFIRTYNKIKGFVIGISMLQIIDCLILVKDARQSFIRINKETQDKKF